MASAEKILEPTTKRNKKGFKLYFVNRTEPGRSYVQVDKPLNTTLPVAGKFYTNNPNISQHDLQEKIEKLKVSGPQEKFTKPMTENQRYGWYHLNIHNTLRYPKRINQVIKENLMNFEKIRSYI